MISSVIIFEKRRYPSQCAENKDNEQGTSFTYLYSRLVYGFRTTSSHAWQSIAVRNKATAFAPVMMSAAIVNKDLSDEILCDPFCGDIANVVLDLTGTFQKSAIFSSAIAIVGRSLVIAANFLPNHATPP
jgi:hypothetical protein